MNWLDKLERKFHRFAIPHITRYMILANLIGTALIYLYTATGRDFFSPLVFSPAYILKGQIWRLVSWIFMPTYGLSFFSLLFILCLLMLGENLEYGLGSFRMTIYFLGAILLSDIGGMIIYLVAHVTINLTLYYALFSMYMMLGLFMPDAEVRIYFILPIRMKYMIVLYAVMFAFEIFQNFQHGIVVGFALSAEMIFAIINLLIFVAACKRRPSPYQAARQRARQQQFRREARAPQPPRGNGGAMHKCVICGRTELTNPELTFRYCSKCIGAKEYCNDHLFTHTHN